MNKNILTFTILCAALVFFSCKQKDNVYSEKPNYSGSALVGFNNYMNSDQEFGLYSIGFPIKDSFVTTNVVLKLENTTSPADHDIKIYLAKNDAVVTDYNSIHGTSYVPVSVQNNGIDFDLSQPIILRAGQREVSFPIRVNSVRMGSGGTPALGLVIASVDGASVSTLQNKLVVAFVARNQYDGKYLLRGAFYHPTASPNNATYQINVEMHTTGPNSVKMYSPDFGGYYHPWVTGNPPAFTAFSGQEPNYTIDPVTNVVTVQNTAPGAVTFYTMAAGYNSRYVPATKTIYAKFGYNYAAGGVFDPAATRQFTDTLIYLGPR